MVDEIRCPMCGRNNPPDLDVCQYCQARLKPLIAGENEEENLPDWLSSLRQGDQSSYPQEPEDELPSWLQPGEPKAPESEQPDQGAVSDWLTNLRSVEAAGPGASMDEESATLPASEGDDQERFEQTEEDAVPGWLAGFETQQFQPEAALPDTTPEYEEESQFESQMPDLEAEFVKDHPTGFQVEGDDQSAAMPDWLAAVSPAEPEPEPEGLPDWLSGTLETGAVMAVASADEPEEFIEASEELPEITDLPTAGILAEDLSQPSSIQDEFTPVVSDETAPDWLDELVASKPDAVLDAEEPAQETESEIPDWLMGYDKTPALEDDGSQLFLDEQTRPGELLDWLGEEAGDTPKEPETAPEEAALASFVAPFTMDDEELLPASEETPEWMAEQLSFESPIEATAESAEEETEGLVKAELPSWLESMRPLESAAPMLPAYEESEKQIAGVGPLAGLRSVLPSEFDVGTIKTPTAYSTRLRVSESQKAHINLIDDLIKSEGEPGEIPSRRALGPQHLLFIGIAAVILLALLWPVLTGNQLTALPGFTPEVFETSNQVNNLPNNAAVLMAVDYEAGMTGEMEAASSALIDHLMIKGAYLTLVSTLPSGPAQAERLIQETGARAGHTYQSSANYTNLGYIPGSISGIRLFAETPPQLFPYALDGSAVWQQGPLAGFQSINDFAMVVVLTENPNTARAWVEQAGPELGDVPLVMVVSAQIEPVVRPYFESESKQIKGIVAGLPGGASYEELLGRGGLARRYWDAYSLGISLIALMIIIGAVANVTHYLLSSRKAAAGEVKR